MSFNSNLFSTMAFLSSDLDMQRIQLLAIAVSTLVLFVGILAVTVLKFSAYKTTLESLNSFSRFFYVSFLKPHTGNSLAGQQGALESFYKAQVREECYLLRRVADDSIEGRYL